MQLSCLLFRVCARWTSADMKFNLHLSLPAHVDFSRPYVLPTRQLASIEMSMVQSGINSIYWDGISLEAYIMLITFNISVLRTWINCLVCSVCHWDFCLGCYSSSSKSFGVLSMHSPIQECAYPLSKKWHDALVLILDREKLQVYWCCCIELL